MNKDTVWKVTCFALGMLSLLLAASACADSGSNGVQPPCDDTQDTPGLCSPQDVSALNLFTGPQAANAAYSPTDTSSVEDVLEKGLKDAQASPVHLAVRGTPKSGSVRCAWRGVARTLKQREDAIRFWLDLKDTDTLPTPAEVERRFTAELQRIKAAYPQTVTTNFAALAQGGLSTDYRFLTCYVDYTVHEYLLGAGTTGAGSTLTVAYDRMGEVESYDLYKRAHALGEFGDEQVMTEGEYEDGMDFLSSTIEAVHAITVGGRESVVFLAPMGAHNAIAVEAWQAVEQWDLQTTDGVVHAVRYSVPEGDPEHSQTLANLKSRITAAATTDKFAGKRIANVSGLNKYYRDIGAYGDITPGDGKSDTFTPAQPPAKLTCANGTAVASPNVDRGLVHDCEALLAAKVHIGGSLNWSASTAVTSWDGVTVSGTPKRVTQLRLKNKGLSGTLHSTLGDLSALTALDLSNNSLRRGIPRELGLLHNLTELRLSGNRLGGCIPVALKDVATNDLASLNLLYCAPPAPGNLAAGTSTASAVPLTWSAVSNASKYRTEYRVRGPNDWTLDDSSLTSASRTVSGLTCETDYQFRVSAYGSGTTYAGAWGEPSAIAEKRTGTCPVQFGASTYDAPEGAITNVTLQLGRALERSVSVPITTTDVTAESADYLISGVSGGAVTIPAGSASATFGVNAHRDSDCLDETLQLGFGTLSGLASGTPSTTTVTIKDDDACPSVLFDAASHTVFEGTSHVFQVRLSTSGNQRHSVPVTVTNGTAESGDYTVTGLTSGAVEFPGGRTYVRLTIAANQDADCDDETVTLGLGTLTDGLTAGTPSTLTVTLDDDDGGPGCSPVKFSALAYSATEGSTSTVTVQLGRALAQSATVPVSVSAGTAESGDYAVSGLPSGGLAFAAGETSKTFTVTAAQDADCDDETVELAFGTLPAGVSRGLNPSATLTLRDDDTSCG